MRTMIFGKYTLSARAESNKTVTRCGCVESTDTSALRSAEINRKKHPPHLSVQGMPYINFYAAFFSFLRSAARLIALPISNTGIVETERPAEMSSSLSWNVPGAMSNYYIIWRLFFLPPRAGSLLLSRLSELSKTRGRAMSHIRRSLSE